jgi:hypothetical protein
MAHRTDGALQIESNGAAAVSGPLLSSATALTAPEVLELPRLADCVEPDQTTEDTELTALREATTWFLEIDDVTGKRCHYRSEDIPVALRTAITEGRHDKDAEVVVHSKTEEKWSESKSTLAELAQNHFPLRVLYQPVWSHAMAGLKWGALVGIGLKLLDTFVLLGSVDPGLALLLLLAAGVCFIPRLGFGAVLVMSFVMMKFTQVNLFLVLGVASLTGALLGCLPGMAIGGIIGLIRRSSLPVAKDASPEAPGTAYQAVVLPMVGGGALLAFYLFVFNPWLLGLLEG